MPDIKKLSVELVEGGRLVTVSAFIHAKADLEADDMAEIERLVLEAGTVGVKAVDAKPVEEPKTEGRRRRGAAPVEEPKEEAPAEAGRRRRGAPAGGAKAEEAPAETGRRRRGVAAAPADDKPKISDADLTKAGAAALAELINQGEVKSNATAFILDILGEFKNAKGEPCDNVADLQGDDRQKFLDELKKEKLI